MNGKSAITQFEEKVSYDVTLCEKLVSRFTSRIATSDSRCLRKLLPSCVKMRSRVLAVEDDRSIERTGWQSASTVGYRCSRISHPREQQT
jgi:hypothetical protein